MNFSTNASNGTDAFDEGFYLIAFNTLGNKNYLILTLVLIYLITVLCNLIVLVVCLINSSLHNPKFLAVCNLAVVDISINSVIIPQMVPVFVFNLSHITFQTCFSQMFFMHFFGDMESFSLALLAYDRLIAICFPLRYPYINTNLKMGLIIVGLWFLVFLLDIFPITLASNLPYCRSRVIQSCCCEHGPVFVLACGDISFNKRLATAKTLVVLLGPLTFIILSYAVVVFAVLRIASATQRGKAFHTCLTHLVLVLIYYVPVILAYILGNMRLVQSKDVYTAILTVSVTLPPMLNPIIYSLKTEELRDKVLKYLTQPKVTPLWQKQEVIKG
ncbi:olfactory receptor 10A6-like [Pygocentrus nattereri]|uniref:G-protein coupled receptors family 1 profile domain-containing protein n=1 Tax=Pygocentrus nattereri TaxID=42514 RepID=A0A3B4C869_PYGNA|nr:olfactory receptor 10A6-like [Pygocentrus nattereri]